MVVIFSLRSGSYFSFQERKHFLINKIQIRSLMLYLVIYLGPISRDMTERKKNQAVVETEIYVWLLQGREVELVGPAGPCRSPGGLEHSLLTELLLRSAPLSTLHGHNHTSTLMETGSTQKMYFHATHMQTNKHLTARHIQTQGKYLSWFYTCCHLTLLHCKFVKLILAASTIVICWKEDTQCQCFFKCVWFQQ